jgi:hypothetical protein
MLRKQSSGLELTLNRSKLLKTPVFKRGIVFQVMHLQDLLGKYWNSGSVVLSCGHIQRCFKKYKKLDATTWQLHGNQALQWKIYRWKRSIHAPSMEEQCSTVQPTAVPSVGWLQGVRISNIKIWTVQLSISPYNHQPQHCSFLPNNGPFEGKIENLKETTIFVASFYPQILGFLRWSLYRTLWDSRCFEDASPWTRPHASRSMHPALSALLQSHALRYRSYRMTRISIRGCVSDVILLWIDSDFNF